MEFYFTSLFSVIPLGIAYGIAALVFWGVVRATKDLKRRGAVLAVAGVVLLLLPISEELWIAWNFGSACKTAGTWIYKQVRVDGFYDDTSGPILDLVRPGAYSFVEGRGRRGISRMTLGNADAVHEAYQRFRETNPGKDPRAEDVLRARVADGSEILVHPKRGEAWRIAHIDRPTARYHYKTLARHQRVSHQVERFEDVVVDTQTGETIARRIQFTRDANWFYIGLDRPTIECKANRGKPLLIYLEALIPSSQ